MWKVIVMLVVLGLLSGCHESPEQTAERVAEQQSRDASDKVNFRCVEGYLFVERYSMGGYSGGIGLAQFWEIDALGNPRPRLCGGKDAY